MPSCDPTMRMAGPDEYLRAHEELTSRDVAVSEVQVLGENPGPTTDPLDNVGFIFFEDPDGNAWAVQQISTRA